MSKQIIKIKAHIWAFDPKPGKINIPYIGLEVNLQRVTKKQFSKECKKRAAEWGWNNYVVIIEQMV